MMTATMRSNDTVITAVTTNASASARVERRIARTVPACTMRTAVTISTPARAASGIMPTGPEAASTTTSSTTAWKIAAMRDRPPERTFTAVRAIAPVAGMPPNSADPIEAMPCPTSSRSGSKRPVSAIEAATRPDNSDSTAASAATVAAVGRSAPSAVGSSAGRLGAGRPAGSAPMRVSGFGITSASRLTTTMPTSDPGIAAWMRGASSMHAATIRAAATAQTR